MSTAVNQPDDPRYARDAAPQDRTAPQPQDRTAPQQRVLDHREIVARQREQYGGIKFGSAFFGWLAAMGMALLLTAVVAAAGTALGLARQVTVTNGTIGIAGGIAVLAIIFLSYFCGGYVAGRMARFNGVRQGVAVWVWALLFAAVVVALTAILGPRYNVLAAVNGFPRIPFNEGSLTTAGIVTAIVVAVVALVGAMLGGLAGMGFHRRVDRSALLD